MAVIYLESELFRNILYRSNTINNLIVDLDDLDHRNDRIILKGEFKKALKYLEISDEILQERDDYVNILIDRLKLFVYLDMDENIDINPLAKYIGIKIEPNLYHYVGELIDFETNEYIGLIEYDILYLIVENYPILHLYKELENFDITNNLFQEIKNNTAKYVSIWFHEHQDYFLNDYQKYISNRYYNLNNEWKTKYNILNYISHSNELMVYYLLDNEKYISSKDVTYNTNSDMMYDWYKKFYEIYCAGSNLNIMLYIRNKNIENKIRIDDFELLKNAVRHNNYEIVEYIINNLIQQSSGVVDILYDTLDFRYKNINYTRIVKLLISTIKKYNFKIYRPANLVIKLQGEFNLFKYFLKNIEIDQSGKNDILNLYVFQNINFRFIEFLVNLDVDVNNQNDKGETPLHHLAKGIKYLHNKQKIENSIQIAKILFNNRAGINVINNKGETPLMLLCKYNKFDLVKLFIENGANVNYINNNNTILTLYISNQKIRFDTINNIEYLISKGMNINIPNNSKNNPLLLSIERGLTDITNLLLSKIHNINNIVDENNNTVLMYAGKYLRYNLIKKLVDNNFDVNVTNNFQETIINFILKEITVWRGFPKSRANKILKIIKYLFLKGVDINIPNDNNRTPLMYAIEKNLFEIAVFLIKNGANINITDNNFMTPLIIAGNNLPESKNIIMMLIKNGAENINSILISTMLSNNNNLIKYLIKNGADVNYQEMGNYPLFIAIKNRNLEIVKYLVEHGANINIIDRNNNTTITLAINNSYNSKIFEYLIEYDTNILNMILDNEPLIKPFISAIISADNLQRICNYRDETCILKYIFNKMSPKSQNILKNYIIDYMIKFQSINFSNNMVVRFLISIFSANHILDDLIRMCYIESLYNKKHFNAYDSLINIVLDHIYDLNTIIVDDNYFGESNLLFLFIKLKLSSSIKKIIIMGLNIDINIKDNNGNTPLIKIISDELLSHLDLCKLLIKYGANVNSFNNDYITPLMYSILYFDYYRGSEIVSELVKNGADINFKDARGNTSLIYAIEKYNSSQLFEKNNIVRLIEYLITKGANVNNQNIDGNTPLIYAIKNNNHRLIELLISKKADTNIINFKNKSPLDIALDVLSKVDFDKNQQEQTIINLINAGAKLNSKKYNELANIIRTNNWINLGEILFETGMYSNLNNI